MTVGGMKNHQGIRWTGIQEKANCLKSFQTAYRRDQDTRGKRLSYATLMVEMPDTLITELEV